MTVLRCAIIAFVLMAGPALEAQVFNLEKEVAVEPLQGTPQEKPIPKVKRVPADQLPELGAEDKAKIDKLYKEIVVQLKSNNVDAATKLISKHDVITKQIIISRLLKENPADFSQDR